MTRIRTDVCIIGGGPAGSTLAARLAALGHEVFVVESAGFPRRHLGESLSPGVRPLLNTFGACEAVDRAAFSPVRRVLVNWDAGPVEREDPDARGLLVDRGRFDALLLHRARELGAKVLQPAAVRDSRFCDGEWLITVESDDTRFEIAARFLADASGRRCATGGRKRQTGAPTLALYRYWRGPGIPAHPRIEAGADAWYWGVPLPDGAYNTLVFVDPRTYRKQRFAELIARSGLLDGCHDLTPDSPEYATDATAWLNEQAVTPQSIIVGDAAMAIDPLSSSGVQKAIQTSLAGAIVANTLLRKPESSEAACRFYRSTLESASERHRQWAGEYYSLVAAQNHDQFWQARSSVAAPPPEPNAVPDLHAPLALSQRTEFRELPCIEGSFVVMKQALHHPLLDAPLAFLSDFEIFPLLRHLPAGLTSFEIARRWSQSERVPLPTGLAMTGWLARKGLLVRVAD